MPLPALVSDIPGATTALQAVATQLKDFDGTGPQLLQMQHALAIVKSTARANGDTASADKAGTQLARVQKLYKVFGTVNDKLGPVREWLRTQGFGVVVIPVIVAAAAVAAVVAMTYVIRQTGTERAELELLANHTLTPDQLAALRKQTGSRSLVNVDVGKVVPWLLGGALLYFGGPLLLRSLRKSRAAA